MKSIENTANLAFNGQMFCDEKSRDDMKKASALLAVIRKYVSINELTTITLADILAESGIDEEKSLKTD